MGKLKIGIVGCGGIANQKHFPAMKANSDLCEIVAFCDIIRERAEKGAKAGLFILSFSLLCRSQSPAYDKVGETDLDF